MYNKLNIMSELLIGAVNNDTVIVNSIGKVCKPASVTSVNGVTVSYPLTSQGFKALSSFLNGKHSHVQATITKSMLTVESVLWNN